MRILIINPHQFGYFAGYYHYCKYLSQKHLVDFVCVDQGLPKVAFNNINIFYTKGTRYLINWRVPILFKIMTINLNKYNFILVNYFKFVSLLRLVGIPHKAILDIRTGYLSDNEFVRQFWNKIIKLESNFFKHMTILSESLRIELNLAANKCTVLPLGAEILVKSSKHYDYPRILYVGTFYNRNIYHTIEAVALLNKKYPNLKIHYDIIGFGSQLEEEKIRKTIILKKTENIIKFHGRKNYEELQPFFEKANIGLSYIPIKKCFNCQPATKNIEYILSGLVCIATKTAGNKLLINEQNGILCYDNPNSLFEAFEEFLEKRDQYESNKIRNTLIIYNWENINNNTLEPLIQEFSKRIG